MKKYILLISIFVLGIKYISAQERVIIHNSNRVMYESSVSDIDSITFQNNNSFFNLKNETVNLAIADIDSITFTNDAVNVDEQMVYILYNNNNIAVINPLKDKGVSIVADQGKVTITSTSDIDNIGYYISGTVSDGSLTINSGKNISLYLGNTSITNPNGAAINLVGDFTSTIILGDNKTSTLSDGTSSTQNATLLSAGALVFKGNGTLNIKGYKKHAISSNKTITVEAGSIGISEAASDGFHSEGFVMQNGNLVIQASGDAIDAGKGTIDINDGNINITSVAQDVKGIKSDVNITISGGTIVMNVSGAQSKAISSKKDITFNGGNIDITISGKTVLAALDLGYDPSYCTAIKSDGNIVVNNGTIKITAPSSNDGAKGFSADGNITVYNGNITVTTAGTGTTYTNETGAKDSYTAACIKSDVDIYLYGGTISCTSTGGGGKGISADGILVIGESGASNDKLILNIKTSGERFYVSGSGESADYANPKAAKSEGNLTVNSGTITIVCTQSSEGGEGLESKATLTINGGLIEISAYDDCINASTHIEITGGNIHCTSSGNDAIDSNGTLSVSGGLIIANGSRSPEAGFDCDQSRFAVTGGILIGTGGSTSTPTTSASTQRSIVYSGTAGNAICIKNSSNEIILLYQMPTYTGSGSGGGPGGGSSSTMTLLYSGSKLSTGSYTLQYGGTISGGTSVNGYNTGGTYSGGSSKSFTISSTVTTVR